MKYKVTNTSQLSDGGKRNVFLTEAGKLIKPGEHCLANRLDNGTVRMADAKVLLIEEGNFAAAPLFDKQPVAPIVAPTPGVTDDQKRAAADAKAMNERIAKEKEAAAAKAQADADAADAKAKADAESEAAAQAEAEEAAAEKAKADDAVAEADTQPGKKKKKKSSDRD